MSLHQDVRYAVRQFLKSPGFTISAVLSLMLGIGATTAIFSVVYGILLDPYPYKDANRIVHVEEHLRNGGFAQLMVNRRQFEDIRGVSSVEDVFFEDKRQANLTGEKSPVALNVGFYSSNFFKYMGVPPLLGREFTSGDAPGGNPAPVAVLSYLFWQEHYGGSPEVIGRALELDHVSYTVIGVVPRRFTWGDSDVYLLSALMADPYHYVIAFPRLKPGTKYAAAEAEFQVLVDRFAKEDQKNYPQQSRVKIASLNEELLGSFAGTVVLLFGAVVVLLGIGCTNVSNLLLARGIARRHEFAVRTSVGASRGRLMRQLLTESILLSVTGAALGVLASFWGAKIISRMLPYDSIPHEAAIGLNGPVLIFSAAIAVMTGILFGISPAYQLSRPQPGSLLRGGSAPLVERTHARRMHRLPIAGQVALTLLLMAAAGGAIKGFLARIHTPLGFNPDNVFQMFVVLPKSVWQEPINQRVVLNQLEMVREAVAQAPGVTGAGISLTWLPLRRERVFSIDIQSKPALSETYAALMLISPQVISVLRIPLLRGRVFDDAEFRGRAPLAMVNQAFVDLYLRASEPIGQIVRIRRNQFLPEVPLEVIGVIGDAINDELDPVKPAVFLPYSLDSNLRPGGLLFARASSDPEAAMRSAKARLSEMNPDLVVTQVRTFRQSLQTYGWGNERLAATILAIYAATALVLAASGIYGVVSFAVTHQKQALGIRLALGARRATVVQLVLRSTAEMFAVGAAAGLIVTLILSPIILSWGGGSASDPFTLLAAAFILVVVAALASIFPAWRAASIDPMQVLRVD
jgi:predicted permease